MDGGVMRLPFRHLLPLFLLPAGWALADWAGKDGFNNTLIFDALSAAGNILPKAAISDSVGYYSLAISPDGAMKVDASGKTRPVSPTGTWSVNVNGSLLSNTATVGGVLQDSPPWTLDLNQVNSSNLGSGNPLQSRLIVDNGSGNAYVSSGNSLPATCMSGCTDPVTETALPTYAAAINFSASGTAGFDRSCLWGSLTKTVRLKRLNVAAYSATTNMIVHQLVKRVSPNTGGTPLTLTAAKMDSGDSNPTATAVTYSGNPTGGTLDGRYMTFPLSAAPSPTKVNLNWGFVVRGSKAIILRGQNEGVCFYGVTGIAVTHYISWEWTEE
jgi:hypothetical protein